MRLAIYSSSNFNQSFTLAHLEYLQPALKLSGDPLPNACNGVSFFKSTLKNKLVNYLAYYFSGNNLSFEEYTAFRMLKNYKLDILFVEFGFPAADILPIAKKLKVPLVTGFYGYDVFLDRVEARYKEKYIELFKYGIGFLAQSRSIKERLVNLGCNPDKVLVNPCPPNPQFENVEVNPTGKQLLFIGRFVPKKAPHLLILAFHQVLKTHPDAVLKMAGDGPLMGPCRDLVDYLEIGSSVAFVGRIDRAQQITLLRETAIQVQHSVTALDGDQEGIPVVLMEASMVGLPVVSTLHSGIPEMIQHEETGLLVAERDVDGMAAAITRLLNDPDLMRELGSKGREYMLQNHTMEQHIAGINLLLENHA